MASLPLKVIALISGGKDSVFSILHCLSNGHEVVALANLHPPSLPGVGQLSEDIDSFMYQTVGHAVIPLYAEALGIPLFREEIVGAAVDTGREYSLGENGDDETEDLVPLLERVMDIIPEANAICTGAILSTYQRTRVEAIATRLKLTPLSYLWQYMYLPPYRQTSLLDDMCAVGQDSRIIKVASGGLDSGFLWQNVAHQRTVARMGKRMRLYGGGAGGAVIGEGGEFETLALTGPKPLWKQGIQVGHVETVTGEGGSASARLSEVSLTAIEPSEQRSIDELRIPPLLDNEFEKVLHTSKDDIPAASSQSSPETSPGAPGRCWTTVNEANGEDPNLASTTPYVQLANIMSAPYGSASDQMIDITHQILFKLHRLSRSPNDIIYATILLRDMSSFATINPIYGSLFTQPNPPSRVTVSCGDLLPDGIHMVISLIVNMDTEKRSRQGLHVQSRSYWAPANIGPYSQAISMPLRRSPIEDGTSPRLVYVAGQIPLVPASMEIVTAKQVFQHPITEESEERREFVAQSVLSLQHLWRIGRAMDVSAWTGAVAFLSSGTVHETAQRAAIACKTWHAIHKVLGPAPDPQALNDDDGEPDDVDVWDIKNRVAQLDVEEGDCRPSLPDFTKIFGNAKDPVGPHVFVAEVEELPRSAQIEWCSIGIAARYQSIAYRIRTLRKGVRGYDCVIKASETHETTISYFAVDDVQALDTFIEDMGQDDAYGSVTIYSSKSVPERLWVIFPSAMLVPCHRLWHGGEGGVVRSIEVMITMRKDMES